MKNKILLLLTTILIISTTSCKKAVEQAKEEAVIGAITDGTWYVSRFVEGGVNITADFTGWEFQYFQNFTSIANKTGNASIAGTWSGNATTFAFTASFNTTPPAPLNKLASTWTVTRAVSTTKGSYSRTESGVVYQMDLTKK